MIHNWINQGSGRIVELIESQYINVSTYIPLSVSSYVKLSAELESSKKGLIIIKNKDQKYFLWCHVKHINPVKIHPEIITQNDKKFANDLVYDRVGFPLREKDFSKIETKNNICINVFCYENKLVFPICIPNQKCENSMDFLLGISESKSHYVYIKDFNRFMFQKTKNKNKKYFCKSCLSYFSSENVLSEQKKDCLGINGGQSVKLEKGTIEFKGYFKQTPIPYKIYADFECNLKSVQSYEGSYSKKYQDLPCSFAYRLVCVDDNFTKLIIVFRAENAAYDFTEAILSKNLNNVRK